ncbi:hypothetical protein THAOC_22543, partial [Thalassiosira oceanica]
MIVFSRQPLLMLFNGKQERLRDATTRQYLGSPAARRTENCRRQPPAPAGGLVQHSTNPTSASARPVLKDCTNQPTPRESPWKPEPAPSKREPFTVPSGTCSAVVKPEKKKKLKKTKKEDTAHSNEVYPKNLEFRGEQFIRDNVNKDHATYRCGFWRQTATSKCGCKLRYYPTSSLTPSGSSSGNTSS